MKLSGRLAYVFLLIHLTFACHLAMAEEHEYRAVTKVIDGDTIVVKSVGKVRLIGVDTPETKHPKKPVEYFGAEASQFLTQLLEGKTVRLEYDWQKRDKFKRVLAYVYLPDGTFVNAEIIKQGYGHAYTQFPFKHLEEFRNLERQARESNKGLWAPRTNQIPSLTDNKANIIGKIYRTKTGTKYHADGCEHLKSKVETTPEEVEELGLTPCKVCHP